MCKNQNLGITFCTVIGLEDIMYNFQSQEMAVLLDAMTRMLISDMSDKFMPKFLKKTNNQG
ncbi:hypothetical protein [Ligilactobacillus equi]